MRRFKKTPDGEIRTSGAHIKVRDYFMHCLHHPRLDPYLYFTPDSVYHTSDVWSGISTDRIVADIQFDHYDLFFVTGKDWKFLPKALDGKKIIHVVQSLDQCEKNHPVFRYFKKPAFRICVSREIEAAIRSEVPDRVAVIPNGIPLELFSAGTTQKNNSILIWAKKQPQLGAKLYKEISDRGLDVTIIHDHLPREQFAKRLGESDILVCLPQAKEGFYLPALEGMASACVVVCPDVVGNREFCIAGETCLMPAYGDLDDHLRMIQRLLTDNELKEKIRRNGVAMAQSYSLERERAQFHQFLKKYILA